MKIVFIRKVQEYDATFDGKFSKYEGYRLIGLQKYDPGIIKRKNIYSGAEINGVFCSGSKRGIESASLLSGKRFTILTLLNEVKFDLLNLLTIREYEKYGSNLVRERFIESFIKDDLEEKNESIKKRIITLLNFLETLPEDKYILISHSFFMKILQIYIKEKCLFDDPQLIRKYFDCKKKTFEFGKGFDFNVK